VPIVVAELAYHGCVLFGAKNSKRRTKIRTANVDRGNTNQVKRLPISLRVCGFAVYSIFAIYLYPNYICESANFVVANRALHSIGKAWGFFLFAFYCLRSIACRCRANAEELHVLFLIIGVMVVYVHNVSLIHQGALVRIAQEFALPVMEGMQRQGVVRYVVPVFIVLLLFLLAHVRLTPTAAPGCVCFVTLPVPVLQIAGNY
jgi:hypothetical protein